MKSQETELLQMVKCILKDAFTKCSAEVRLDRRDFETIESRVKHEGISFLTITLPQFGSDFERSLANERVDSTAFRSFRKTGAIPSFLKGMLSQVFDQVSGVILPDPCIASIEGIRQIAHTFKKVKLPCSPLRIAQAFRGFVECEQDLSQPISPEDTLSFMIVSDLIWDTVLAPIEVFDTIPKHGPGATAEGISGNQKYQHQRWHKRLEPYFPLYSTAFSSETAYDTKESESIVMVSPEDEQPVRVITVPKTLKSPRIIAIEPVCMQYTQQAISKSLIRELERHWLTKGHVNFTDQSINQNLAISSSLTGDMATLDMSSASDRVPLDLALYMFRSNPALQGAIDACRSRRAQLPTGEILTLKKFASMGSALCFPVESMYFYTICVIALLNAQGLQCTISNARDCASKIYVYGDDIVVPTNYAEAVCETLQKYYCKVNTRKSFWTGKFRESCGMDAYAGEPVKPVYLRNVVPTHRKHVEQLVSWVDTSNQFYRKGYWRTASFLQSRVEHILGVLPRVFDTSAALGVVSFTNCYSCERTTGRYQRPEVKAFVPTVAYKHSKLSGYAALTKCLLNLEDRPLLVDGVQDPKHLVRAPQHGAVALKRRWTCVW